MSKPRGAISCLGCAAPPVDDEPVLSLDKLLLLQTWFSSAFPIGAYSFSHGLEWAIQNGEVQSATECRDWIAVVLRYGSARNDLILMDAARTACRAGDATRVEALDALAIALSAGAERHEETRALAKAFACAVETKPGVDKRSSYEGCPQSLPVLLGTLAIEHGLPRRTLLALAGQSFSSNLVWIGARLLPFGQSEALAAINELRGPLIETVSEVCKIGLDGLGSSALLADFASLAHEHQRSRVCRT